MLANPKLALCGRSPGLRSRRHRAAFLAVSGQRYYSPSFGRFINKDPIEEQGGLNLYAFCGNNAITGWDYLGNDPAMTQKMADGGMEGGGASYNTMADATALGPIMFIDGAIDSSNIAKAAADVAKLASATPKPAPKPTLSQQLIAINLQNSGQSLYQTSADGSVTLTLPGALSGNFTTPQVSLGTSTPMTFTGTTVQNTGIVAPNRGLPADAQPAANWSLYRYIYTGNGHAPDNVYNAAVGAAADFLINDAGVRGVYLGAGSGGKTGGSGGLAGTYGLTGELTIDSGASVVLMGGVGLQDRGRNSAGQFTSQTIGAGGAYELWSSAHGFSPPSNSTVTTGVYGGTNNVRGGGNFLLGTSDNSYALGLNSGYVYGGVIIDINKMSQNIADSINIVFGGKHVP